MTAEIVDPMDDISVHMPYTHSMRFKIASHARAHGVSKTRILHALENLTVSDEEAEPGRIVFFGFDPIGTELRMVGFPAQEDPDLIVIINAMPSAWTQGRKW